jgi:hypothetical protein
MAAEVGGIRTDRTGSGWLDTGNLIPGPDPEAPRLWIRRFGSEPFHLDLDLGEAPGEAVTRVLAACLRDAGGLPPREEELLDATLAWRLAALAAVTAASQGSRLAVATRCPGEACGASIEFELDLPNLLPADPGRRVTGRIPLAGGSTEVALRLPTGRDQAAWRREPPPDAASMALSLDMEMDGRPAEDGRRLTGEALEAVGSLLESVDPLTSLQARVECPGCGEVRDLDMDLEALLLHRLESEQKCLMRQVHALASAYHWPEAEILALPPGRRNRYLTLLAES